MQHFLNTRKSNIIEKDPNYKDSNVKSIEGVKSKKKGNKRQKKKQEKYSYKDKKI